MKEQPKSSAINLIFVLFVISSILAAAASLPSSGRMEAIQSASFESAKGAVTLSIGLIGIMALWLGLVRILEAGGMMLAIAQAVKPVMVRLFPDVPAEHPAMGAMLLNISANMLGLGNAATPFGIKAMIELNRLNPIPGTATNAMCLFLAINTSSVTLLPLGVIGVRAAAGSARPADIFVPTLIATLCSTIVGVTIALLLAKRDRAYKALSENDYNKVVSEKNIKGQEDSAEPELEDFSHLQGKAGPMSKFFAWGAVLGFIGLLFFQIINHETPKEYITKQVLSFWLMPGLMLLIVCYGMNRGVKIYEAVTEGAKQGFEIAVRIIPFLVAILVAVAMFRASGVLAWFVGIFNPLTQLIGMPAEVLPMAIVRPLSGSGAFGIMSSLIESAPDSYSAFLASTMMGSTETTFYVLAVYFGAVGVVRIRHALVAALLADVTGIVAACFACQIYW